MWSRVNLWTVAVICLTTTVTGLALLLGVKLGGSTSPPTPGVTSVHTGVTLQGVKELAELTVLKVELADVQETTLGGATGSAKVTLLIAGDARIGTDLAKAKVLKSDDVAHTLVLELPDPVVQVVRLDHSRTKVTSIRRTGMWRLMPSEDVRVDLVNQAFAEAQRALETAANRADLKERARAQAEAILREHFKAVGWQASVAWR